MRTLLAGGGAVAVCGLIWAFLAVSGVPGWLPGRLESALSSLPGVT